MTGRVWRGYVCALLGCALALATSVASASAAGTQAAVRSEHVARHNLTIKHHGAPPPFIKSTPIAAPVVMAPPELDERRRDGHMTPDERKLLRQHIEDAARELYKR